MATVLTESSAPEELARFSFPILKWDQDEDGDLVVKGIATDGTVDSDSQIVDPEWSAKALSDWIATGGNVRQSHDPHRPVGKGLRIDVNRDNSGKHWVTSVIVDPVAQRLVKKGVLTAYSVGISRPVIKHDLSGKARGGIIVGGELAELSIVDRPSNKSSYLELAKSAANGECEFVGKVVTGTDAEKALSEAPKDISSFAADDELFSFTPKDMARVIKEKIIQRHYRELASDAASGYDPYRYSAVGKRDFDRGVGGGVDRDQLSDSDFAGPHRSFPVVNQSDVSDALGLAGHAANPDEVRANIKAIARRKGLSVPDDAKEDTPDLVKDPGNVPAGTEGDAASATPGRELPDPQNLDADGDTDGDGVVDCIPKADTPKPKKGKKGGKKGGKLPPWLNQPAEKFTDPKSASGAEEAADMDSAPLPGMLESPAKDFMKAAESVALRYKTVGIDFDLGVLHDLTCPAFSPEEVAKFHPHATLPSVIDVDMWQRKALTAAVGRSIDEAIQAQQAWQAAACLKAADQADLAAYRAGLHKAFRDANPGPTSFPSPGTLSPKQFNRPCLTDGHAQDSPGYGPPNSAPSVASTAPNAHSFNRPPLSSGQQSPSPSFMKADYPYPERQGVPTRVDYPEIEREKARQALSALHDHINHMFPSSCPMLDQDPYRVEQPIPAPAAVGLAKSEPDEVVLGDVYKYIAKLEKRVRAGLITEAQARDKLSKRTARKYAESLSEQVSKGLTSKSEILRALGIAEPEVVKAEFAAPFARIIPAGSEDGQAVTKGFSPEVMKTMMSEILQPFQEKITAQENMITESQRNAEALQRLVAEQQNHLSEYDRRWEALANSADPSTAPFAALALRKAAPAGAAKSDTSERAQGMIVHQLERMSRLSENPVEREAAYAALKKIQNPLQ